MNGVLLTAVANGDAAARRDLRNNIIDLLEFHGHPLHIASITTSIMAGWSDGTYQKNDLDWLYLFDETVLHNSRRDRPLPPGVLVEVTTKTQKTIVAEVVCTHPDPNSDEFGPDGSIHSDTIDRWLAVLSFASLPHEWQPDSHPQTGIGRLREKGKWLSDSGHVAFHSAHDEEDELHQYGIWLADNSRRSLRQDLPRDPDTLSKLLSDVVKELKDFQDTFVVFDHWVWLKDSWRNVLHDPNGRLNKRELNELFQVFTKTYRDEGADRLIANDTRERAERWNRNDYKELLWDTGWLTTLFVVNRFIHSKIVSGPPIIDENMYLKQDKKWGIAGRWIAHPISDEEVLVEQNRFAKNLKEEMSMSHGSDLQKPRPFPFIFELTRTDFESGHVTLPPDVAERIGDRSIALRLDMELRGRWKSRPAMETGTSGQLSREGHLAFDWPAVLHVGSTINGELSIRGQTARINLMSDMGN